MTDSGWLTNGICKYRKKNGYVTIDIYSTSYNIDVNYITLITLPEGYRPDAILYQPSLSGSLVPMMIYVSSDGTVGIKAQQKTTNPLGHIVFPV